ncbi:beta-ketoacyl-[acyl-carrier-protein] synthase II [Candidatus Desantisbacteria bacterium CG_4_10_14_3_um_filter_40_18]|uniref:Beta-ketoacyl-ACP synthase II n=1 Tax=Candidatus Desantisbacteria bacterium CG_4_10_14_3_um_filter_40_18 TaxID=1974544 RepID=A0A2M7NZK3_9BACT|nr:MAG: beta-ketoacyl-[acyl-carrier-protein] synthase II [Candidatus Desantisbacteria bacterium CG_4_10_14_3_um_filter_40_18]
MDKGSGDCGGNGIISRRYSMPNKNKTTHLWELLNLFNEWEEVQDVLEKTLGCGMQFIDASGQGILERQNTSPVCHLILDSRLGHQRCLDFYGQKCFGENAPNEKFSIFNCHAGLTNFSVPVVIHQKNHTALIVGGLLLGDVKEKWCKQYAKELSINTDVFLNAMRRIKCFPEEEVLHLCRMVNLVVDPLIKNILKYFPGLEKKDNLLKIMEGNRLKVDDLTGLSNRQHIQSRLGDEIHRAREYERQLSLLMIYIDNIREINELYGYEVGNILIKDVADILLAFMQRVNILGRIAGDGFCFILPETDRNKAIKLTKKIQDRLNDYQFCPKEGESVPLKIIWAISSISEEDISAEEFIRQTEQMIAQSRGGTEKRDSDKRCVITGLGIISPIGIGKDTFLEGLLEARSGVSMISNFDTSSLPVKIAGEVKDFEPSIYMNKKQVKRTDRTTQFAIAAANMAIKDATLDLNKEDIEKIGVIIGAGMGGLGFGEDQHLKFIKEGPQKVSPFLSVIMFAGACSSAVSMELGIKGPSITISTGCAAGTDAIGYAFDSIRHGESKIMIVGGAEAPLRPLILTSFEVMGALSSRNDNPQKASRPFDAKRDGFVMGEGAGIVVVEELEHALNRGAHIYAELIGYASTVDAYHMVAPDPSGGQASRAMEMALEDAGVKPEDIEYINVHGSSTPLNDKTETMVIKKVFGPHAYNLAISSTKSMIGHSIGASGGIEIVATLLGMENDFLPPTINHEYPDPDCDLDCVPNKPRKKRINVAMSNSFGFGGKNSVLVIRRYENDKRQE